MSCRWLFQEAPRAERINLRNFKRKGNAELIPLMKVCWQAGAPLFGGVRGEIDKTGSVCVGKIVKWI